LLIFVCSEKNLSCQFLCLFEHDWFVLFNVGQNWPSWFSEEKITMWKLMDDGFQDGNSSHDPTIIIKKIQYKIKIIHYILSASDVYMIVYLT